MCCPRQQHSYTCGEGDKFEHGADQHSYVVELIEQVMLN